MTSQYSRKNKRPNKPELPKKHIKAGLTTLQKTIALVGSILSIVVATITITRALHPETENKKDNNSGQSSSTIVKIIEKDNSSNQKNDSQTKLPSNETNTPSTSSSTELPNTDTTSTPSSSVTESSSTPDATIPSSSTNTQ